MPHDALHLALVAAIKDHHPDGITATDAVATVNVLADIAADLLADAPDWSFANFLQVVSMARKDQAPQQRGGRMH